MTPGYFVIRERIPSAGLTVIDKAIAIIFTTYKREMAEAYADQMKRELPLYRYRVVECPVVFDSEYNGIPA